MYYKTGITRTQEKEFLASEKTVSFTKTVLPDGVEPDGEGRKIVHKGSIISVAGTVTRLGMPGTVTRLGVPGTVTFLGKPAGLLLEAVDVTNGPQPGAVMVEGYVIGERLPLDVEYTEAAGEAIHEKLPEIKFREAAGEA